MSNTLRITKCYPNDLDCKQWADIANPCFYMALIAWQDDEIVAAFSIYQNDCIQHQGEKTWLLGNIHCPDDDTLFSTLLTELQTIARSQNIKHLIGPINGSTWHQYRYSIHTAHETFSGDIAQPLYLPELFRRNGFEILHRYYSSLSEARSFSIDETALHQAGVTIRQIDKQNLHTDLQLLYPLCNEAFAHNELFSPIDETSFVARYMAYKDLLDPRYALLATDAQGAVALFFCYPGLAQGQPAVIIKTIARHPVRRYRGLVDTMTRIIYNNAHQQGIPYIIHAFMHQANRSLLRSGRYSSQHINEYAVYIKTFSHAAEQ